MSMPSPSFVYSLRYAACDTNGSCPSKFHSKLKKLAYFAFLSWGFLFLSHIWPPNLSIFKALSLLSNSHEMFPNSAPTHLNWAWVSSGTIPEILVSAYSCPCPYSSPWLSDVASISMDTSEVKDLCSSCFLVASTYRTETGQQSSYFHTYKIKCPNSKLGLKISLHLNTCVFHWFHFT